MSITLQDIPIINRRSEEQLVNIDDAVTILKSLKENDLCKLEKPDALDLTFTDFKETAAVAINGKAASSYMEPQKAKEYLNKILPLFSDGATVESPNQEMVKKISNATN